MRTVKLSVIIPVYNVEKYLDKCMESVLGQSERDFEVILVDDGSTDACGGMCDKYAEQDGRVRVIHKKNGGLISAWMCGLENSIGNYIVFVDSDDWIGPCMFEKMWEIKEQYDVDIIICEFFNVFKNSKVREKSLLPTGYYDSNRIKKEVYPIMLNAGGYQQRAIPISRCGKLIKKQRLLDNLQYCDIRISYQEDLNIIFPVLLDCNSMVLLDGEDCAYYYRKNPFSILNRYNKQMYEQIHIVNQNLMRVCVDKAKTEFKLQIKADYLAAMVQCYKNELMNPLGIQEGKKRIDKLVTDKYLQNVIEEVKWKQYRKLNVLIINCFMHWNWFNRNVITFILYLLKRARMKSLENYCNRSKKTGEGKY